MKRVTESFSLPCSAERFWRVFLDAEYGKAFYLEELRFKGYTVLSSDESSRKLRIAPRINLPGPIAKLLSEGFAYEEHGRLDRAEGLWSWKMVQPAGVTGKNIVSTSGTIRVVDSGPDQCRRTDEVTIEAHLFGLGGLIESSVEKEVRASWSKELAFFTRWLQR